LRPVGCGLELFQALSCRRAVDAACSHTQSQYYLLPQAREFLLLPVDGNVKENHMSVESEKIIFAKLAGLEDEIKNLREGYLTINKRYSDVLISLKDLTSHSTEAAKRAAIAAEKAAFASRKAAGAAKEAAHHSIILAAEEAAEAAGAAAEAAIEAAAAAASASAAAAAAAAHQAEETAMQAAAEAAAATKRATEAAAEAMRMSNEASKSAKQAKS